MMSKCLYVLSVAGSKFDATVLAQAKQLNKGNRCDDVVSVIKVTSKH